MEIKGTEINPILGDVSLGGMKDGCTENDKIASHLRYVEQLLRSAPNSFGSGERERTIDNLSEYCDEGIFPRGEHSTEAISRKPNFRDSSGTLCAVGYLIQQSEHGSEELINLITRQYQFSYLLDMHLPELVSWQGKSGLSLNELAMIQPTYEFKVYDRALEILQGSDAIIAAAPGSDEEKKSN